MSEEQGRGGRRGSRQEAEAGRGRTGATFEDYPLTRQEYITAMVHLYRGEVYRSNVWRQRLDQTTNWSVIAVGAIITFTFSEKGHTHLLLLLSNLVVLAFLFIEARRFRYFSVYRARVRMLEENFYIPIITRRLESPRAKWRDWVAMDLDVPKFKATFVESLAFRLSYIYVYLFGGILLTWILKVWLHPAPAASLAEFYRRMAIGNVPPWLVLGAGLFFYGSLALVLLWVERTHRSEDEIHGLEEELDHWKV